MGQYAQMIATAGKITRGYGERLLVGITAQQFARKATVNGKVIDDEGNPVSGANVHLYCKDSDLRVHTSTTAADGTFEMKSCDNRGMYSGI